MDDAVCSVVVGGTLLAKEVHCGDTKTHETRRIRPKTGDYVFLCAWMFVRFLNITVHQLSQHRRYHSVPKPPTKVPTRDPTPDPGQTDHPPLHHRPRQADTLPPLTTERTPRQSPERNLTEPGPRTPARHVSLAAQTNWELSRPAGATPDAGQVGTRSKYRLFTPTSLPAVSLRHVVESLWLFSRNSGEIPNWNSVIVLS